MNIHHHHHQQPQQQLQSSSSVMKPTKKQLSSSSKKGGAYWKHLQHLAANLHLDPNPSAATTSIKKGHLLAQSPRSPRGGEEAILSSSLSSTSTWTTAASTLSSSSSSSAMMIEDYDYSSQPQQPSTSASKLPLNLKKRPRRHHDQQRRRRVHFAPTSSLSFITYKSSREIHASWYTEDDTTHFKEQDVRLASRVMHKTKCRHVMECLAYSLVDKTTTTTPAATATVSTSAEEEGSASTTTPTLPILSQETINTMKSHLHPTEKILIRGIEHTVSPSVLEYVAYRRKVAVRKVVREQRRLRRERGSKVSSSREKEEMAKALGEYSRECTAFARDWAVQKLLS